MINFRPDLRLVGRIIHHLCELLLKSELFYITLHLGSGGQRSRSKKSEVRVEGLHAGCIILDPLGSNGFSRFGYYLSVFGVFSFINTVLTSISRYRLHNGFTDPRLSHTTNALKMEVELSAAPLRGGRAERRGLYLLLCYYRTSTRQFAVNRYTCSSIDGVAVLRGRRRVER